ncbi:MAG: hypothetical protein V2A70_03825 [Candidatus Omnitrophota bacterium]
MDEYLKWNNAIAQYFFRGEKTGALVGAVVFLSVDAAAIEDVAEKFGICEKAQAVECFKESVFWALGNPYIFTQLKEFPLSVAYLAFLVLVASYRHSDDETMAHAYIKRLREELGVDPLRGQWPIDQEAMLGYWVSLAKWLQENRDRYAEVSVPESGHRYVRYPLHHGLLTREEMPGFWNPFFIHFKIQKLYYSEYFVEDFEPRLRNVQSWDPKVKQSKLSDIVERCQSFEYRCALARQGIHFLKTWAQEGMLDGIQRKGLRRKRVFFLEEESLSSWLLKVGSCVEDAEASVEGQKELLNQKFVQSGGSLFDQRRQFIAGECSAYLCAATNFVQVYADLTNLSSHVFVYEGVNGVVNQQKVCKVSNLVEGYVLLIFEIRASLTEGEVEVCKYFKKDDFRIGKQFQFCNGILLHGKTWLTGYPPEIVVPKETGIRSFWLVNNGVQIELNVDKNEIFNCTRIKSLVGVDISQPGNYGVYSRSSSPQRFDVVGSEVLSSAQFYGGGKRGYTIRQGGYPVGVDESSKRDQGGFAGLDFSKVVLALNMSWNQYLEEIRIIRKRKFYMEGAF